jgi:hypothetical protein
LATAALEVALTTGDADLELRALAELGLAEVALGRVDSGLGRLDKAMAAAMSGEPATLETFADAACSLMLACDLAGDSERQQQWGTVFEDFVRKYDHVTLHAFAAPAVPMCMQPRAESTQPRRSCWPRFANSQRPTSGQDGSIRRCCSQRFGCSRAALTRQSSCWADLTTIPMR